MATTQSTAAHPLALSEGDWHVVPARSELGFATRILGLVPVRGRFSRYDGDLHVDGPGDARGDLRIDAATISTGIKKRDTHLRSPDYFHVEAHPHVRFDLAALTPDASGALTLTGTLHIRDETLPISAPVSAVQTGPDEVRLDADFKVDHRASGLGWRAPTVRVRAALALERMS